jgi:hypothetical protein
MLLTGMAVNKKTQSFEDFAHLPPSRVPEFPKWNGIACFSG